MTKKSNQNTTRKLNELLIYGSETNRYHYIVFWIQKFVKKYHFDNIAVTKATLISEFIAKNLEKVPAVEFMGDFVYCKHTHVDAFLLEVAELILLQSANDSIKRIDLVMNPENIDYKKLIVVNNLYKNKAAYIRMGLQYHEKYNRIECVQLRKACREQLFEFILFQGLENSIPIIFYDVEERLKQKGSRKKKRKIFVE